MKWKFLIVKGLSMEQIKIFFGRWASDLKKNNLPINLNFNLDINKFMLMLGKRVDPYE